MFVSRDGARTNMHTQVKWRLGTYADCTWEHDNDMRVLENGEAEAAKFVVDELVVPQV